MAAVTLETTVKQSDIVAGHTVFEIDSVPEASFKRVSISPDTILSLLPVHYKYINTEKIPPVKYAIKGEFHLSGKRITLMA